VAVVAEQAAPRARWRRLQTSVQVSSPSLARPAWPERPVTTQAAQAAILASVHFVSARAAPAGLVPLRQPPASYQLAGLAVYLEQGMFAAPERRDKA
jgi:hypothetical protein